MDRFVFFETEKFGELTFVQRGESFFLPISEIHRNVKYNYSNGYPYAISWNSSDIRFDFEQTISSTKTDISQIKSVPFIKTRLKCPCGKRPLRAVSLNHAKSALSSERPNLNERTREDRMSLLGYILDFERSLSAKSENSHDTCTEQSCLRINTNENLTKTYNHTEYVYYLPFGINKQAPWEIIKTRKPIRDVEASRELIKPLYGVLEYFVEDAYGRTLKSVNSNKFFTDTACPLMKISNLQWLYGGFYAGFLERAENCLRDLTQRIGNSFKGYDFKGIFVAPVIGFEREYFIIIEYDYAYYVYSRKQVLTEFECLGIINWESYETA